MGVGVGVEEGAGGGSSQPLLISQGASLTSHGVCSSTRGSPAVDCHSARPHPEEVIEAAASSPVKRLQHLNDDFPPQPKSPKVSRMNRWNARGNEGASEFTSLTSSSTPRDCIQ